jgi:hypothetical protein
MTDHQRTMEAAVAEVLDGSFPSAWVLAVEAIGKDGEAYLLHMVSEDMNAWKLMGMLHFTIDSVDALLGTDDTQDLD